MSNRRLKTGGVALCAVQTPAKDTALRGIAALRQNLRATPLKLESLVGWIAAMVSLVLAVQIFG